MRVFRSLAGGIQGEQAMLAPDWAIPHPTTHPLGLQRPCGARTIELLRQKSAHKKMFTGLLPGSRFESSRRGLA